MEPVSSIAHHSSSASLTYTASAPMQLMTATGTGSGSAGVGATPNKAHKQPAVTHHNSVGIARKVVQPDLSNYNLDHLYCHPNEKKSQPPPVTQQQPAQQPQAVQTASPFLRSASAATATGGPGPGTDIVAVIKEINQLRTMLLLHLDLIQEQSDQIMSKDKLIGSLRKETETLRQKVIELSASPAAAPATVCPVPTQPAPVITKSGRCSRPVLYPTPVVAVAKDDAANKVQLTIQAKSPSPLLSLKTIKTEVLDLDGEDQELLAFIDPKSEMLKKISTKLLANCSEKLISLSASMESALNNTIPCIKTEASPTRIASNKSTSPANPSTVIAKSEPSSDHRTDIKPILSLLSQPKVSDDRTIDAKINLLQSDLLTQIKTEDLGKDVQEILSDYVNIKVNLPTSDNAPIKEAPLPNAPEETIEPKPEVVQLEADLKKSHSSRRRRRHDGTGHSRKRRRVGQLKTVPETNPECPTIDPDPSRVDGQPITTTPSATTILPNLTQIHEPSAAIPIPISIPIVDTEPPSLAPPPLPVKPRERSFYSGRRSFMTTKQLYTTREWQMNEIAEAVNNQIADLGDEEQGSSASTEQVNLEIPRWKVCEFTPSTITTAEATIEDLSEEAFHKRHVRFELDEKKRKKWDIQRIREQRNVERLRKRLLKEDPSDAVKGPEELGTFYPPAENIKYIQITDDLPIQAFGEFIPVIAAAEFSLPWQIPAETSPANRSANAFDASPAGHLRSSDRAVAAAGTTLTVAHTSIQLVKKKCVRRHYASAATSANSTTATTAPTAKGKSTKRRR